VSRLARAACAAIVLVSVLSVARLTTPSWTAACSCAPPGNIAEVAGDPEIFVLTGPPPPATTGDVDLASIALIAVGALVAIVLVGAVVLAFGRRETTTP
jgi:hypothetical protein